VVPSAAGHISVMIQERTIPAMTFGLAFAADGLDGVSQSVARKLFSSATKLTYPQLAAFLRCSGAGRTVRGPLKYRK
jgi:hypothetical protein